MRKIFLTLLLGCLFLSIGRAQGWIKEYQNIYTGYHHHSLQTLDGGFMLAGSNSAWDSDIILIKTTAVGDIEWIYRYPKVGREILADIVQIPSDSSYSLIYKNTIGLTKSNLLRVSVTGQFIADYTLNIDADAYQGNVVLDMLVTDEEDLLIVGTKDFDNLIISSRITLSKVNLSGTVIWDKTYASPVGQSRVGISLQKAINGNYTILGYQEAITGGGTR